MRVIGATLGAVRRLVTDEALVMRLKHWPRVPTGLLSLLFEAPVVAELHWLRDEIATTEDHFAVARLVEQRRRFVRDTVRMLGVIRRDDDGDAFDIRRYKSWKSLKALHDRLITAARRMGWGSLLDAELPAQQAFPAPPIPSDHRFSAIANVAELIQEAERMHHCVVTRAVDVVAGRCALYRVNVGGERATLELRLGAKGRRWRSTSSGSRAMRSRRMRPGRRRVSGLPRGRSGGRRAVTTWMVDAGERVRRSSCSWWLEHFRNRR